MHNSGVPFRASTTGCASEERRADALLYQSGDAKHQRYRTRANPHATFNLRGEDGAGAFHKHQRLLTARYPPLIQLRLYDSEAEDESVGRREFDYAAGLRPLLPDSTRRACDR